MKTFISLIFLCLLAASPLQRTQAERNTRQLFSIGVNIYNGTGYNGALYMYGPTNLSANLAPGAASYGPLNPGNYTVYLYTSAPGTHTFTFNGISVTTASGYAAFNNVNLTSTTFASIV